MMEISSICCRLFSVSGASQQHHDAFLRATPAHMLVVQATRTALEASTVISHQDQWVQLRNSSHLIDYLGCVVMRFNFASVHGTETTTHPGSPCGRNLHELA